MSTLRRLATGAAAATLVGTLGWVAPASAAYDDSFSVSTPDGCGSIEFVDYGDTPNGKRDDFVVVHDWCADGKGVRGHVTTWWHGDETTAWRLVCHNGNGLAGAPKYCTEPDLYAGQQILISVQLTRNGTPIDGTMGVANRTMVDG